jgi:AGCS family alanine or glycine:cation symporter
MHAAFLHKEVLLMEFLHGISDLIVKIIMSLNKLFWGDLLVLSFNNGDTKFGLSILVLILIPAGLYFTVKSRFLPFRLFPEMLRATYKEHSTKNAGEGSVSGVQALIVATASRVGMGNLAGVVAAISVGGPGAVFWMWMSALIGSASAFVESTLAQIYKEKDPLYGGYRGGPAYFMKRIRLVTRLYKKDAFPAMPHGGADFTGKNGVERYAPGCSYNLLGLMFALSGLLCWAGISQVIANSVTTAFHHAFGIPQLNTTIALVLISGCIVLRKNATVKVLSKTVPFVACAYLAVTVYIFCKNIAIVPQMLSNIFLQALGVRQFLGGGLGVIIMNGVKRGLFSNEAGSGSAPCAAAAATVIHPVSQGLIQALGVFIDTLVICSCSAFVMLLAPTSVTQGLTGMAILQAAMNYHMGNFGSIFVAGIIFLLSFSNVAGILFYARGNVAYIFGNTWSAQTGYKIFVLGMLFIGGIAAYEIVWELGDLGVALMTVFNMMAVLPLSGQAFKALRDYERKFLKKEVTWDEPA